MATMNKPEVQTLGSRTDTLLVSLAVLIALAGVIGFTFWSGLALAARLGMLAGGVLVGAGVAWFSEPGKRFIAFTREAWDETRRVVWPDRKETLKATGVVFVFVSAMALLLFLIDKGIEFGLYDVILGWKR